MTTQAVAAKLDAALDALLASDAPLGQGLTEYANVLRRLNQPFAEAVDRLVDRLAVVDAGANAPIAGSMLPDFMLPDEEGHLVVLPALLQKGPLVVAFRRGHWCPYCQISTNALVRMHAEAEARGVQLVVITPERAVFGRSLKTRTHAKFPILSDMDNGYAMSIGLAISVGEEMREFMTVRGRDLATYQGNDAWLLPIPATFVLNQQGTIVMRHVDPDYRRRAEIEDILAALDALKRQS